MFYKINLTLILFMLMPSVVYAGAMEELCGEVKTYAKPPMWGADYVANIDVHGRKVAPADLSSSNILPDPMIIPVKIDLIQRFGLALPADMEMDPEVLRINIFSDGSVTYNDQDITAKVKKTCNEYHEENLDQTLQPHGQNSGNAVPSDDTIDGQYPPLNE